MFLLETDEGTKSNAIKGNVDLEALTTENKYKVDSPVTRAKVVVVNEIDKDQKKLKGLSLFIYLLLKQKYYPNQFTLFFPLFMRVFQILMWY